MFSLLIITTAKMKLKTVNADTRNFSVIIQKCVEWENERGKKSSLFHFLSYTVKFRSLIFSSLSIFKGSKNTRKRRRKIIYYRNILLMRKFSNSFRFFVSFNNYFSSNCYKFINCFNFQECFIANRIQKKNKENFCSKVHNSQKNFHPIQIHIWN